MRHLKSGERWGLGRGPRIGRRPRCGGLAPVRHSTRDEPSLVCCGRSPDSPAAQSSAKEERVSWTREIRGLAPPGRASSWPRLPPGEQGHGHASLWPVSRSWQPMVPRAWRCVPFGVGPLSRGLWRSGSGSGVCCVCVCVCVWEARVWVCVRVWVWVCGCVGVWVCGCVGVWVWCGVVCSAALHLLWCSSVPVWRCATRASRHPAQSGGRLKPGLPPRPELPLPRRRALPLPTPHERSAAMAATRWRPSRKVGTLLLPTVNLRAGGWVGLGWVGVGWGGLG